MRLAYLELQNFRSFREAKLNLEADGLIGVRGANGAGKSSVFEAIEFALYGKRRGGPPVRRTGAEPSDPFMVLLRFNFEEHLIEVERNEATASFIVDGQERATSLRGVSAAAARELGLTREQFIATFYARQKEIEAFARADQRRDNIERLLGLTQLRVAAVHAQKGASERAATVRALADDLEDVAEAKRLLADRRERAASLAPAAEKARKERDDLAAERGAAWEALTAAEDQAKARQEALTDARLAAEHQEVARRQVQEAETAVSDARQAARELDLLRPLASQHAERRARVAELDLRKQAFRQYLVARDARSDAQRRRAELQDRLDDLVPPKHGSAELSESLKQVRGKLDHARNQLGSSGDAERAIAERLRRAEEAGRVIARAAELDQLLQALPRLETEARQTAEAQFQLEAQRIELVRAVEAERIHRDEVERDGPDARCIRCRRHYGDRYNDILREFAKAIASFERRLEQAIEQLSTSRAASAELATQLDELRRVEGERASLSVPEDPPEDVEVLAEQLSQAKALGGRLREEVASHTEREAALEAAVEQAREREARRHDLIDALAQVQAEEEAYSQQLAGLTVDSYDEVAHEQARAQLSEAEDAEQRCAVLRGKAEQLELLERRCVAAKERLEEAVRRGEQTKHVVAGYERADEVLHEAKERLKAMDRQMQALDAKVLEAEQLAIAESKDVEAAEEAVKRALAQKRRLRRAQRESRHLDATAGLLDQYATHAQRRALPALEKEAAQLLARLTGGSYDDVRLDERAALQIYDNGQHHRLDRFSGGEQDLAHLCLRLALSKTFARQRGTDAGLIILDEVFGSQDLDRRRALLDQLRDLDREFSQVFIVSHFDDVAAFCDLQIKVERVDGVSEARLASD